MQESSSILSVLAIFTLAIISPGPNFLMVVQTALSAPRSCALATAAGVATGSGLFALTGMVGVMSIISSIPHFSTIARLIGGSYLCYLALRMLLALRQSGGTPQSRQLLHGHCPTGTYFRIGLVTNLTNPKAWGFYLSLFTLVVSPSFGLLQKGGLTLSMFLISLLWYSIVALFAAGRKRSAISRRFGSLVQTGLALLLLYFGGQLLSGIGRP